MARHVEVKNLSLLLEACSSLKQGGTNFRCVLIGDGPLHEQLLAQGERLGFAPGSCNCVAAEQQEVLNWWQEADIGVLTSQNEGMPVCLMEAAACGVPVVATRVGGIPELVKDGATGLLTPPGDAAAMARVLGKLLSNEELRQGAQAAARARAEMKFSVVRQVDELLTTWTRALDKMKYESRDAY